MKKLLPVACILALAASIGFPQDPPVAETPATDLAQRVEFLEKQLASTRKELADSKVRVDGTVAYLHAQAAGAKSMLETLTASEEAGFVPGPNFHSRELLLAGMRTWWSAKGKNLPAKPAAAPASPAPKAPTRRAGGR